MRLIDADKLEYWEIAEVGGEYSPYMGCSRGYINKQPTIQAVTIEVLDKIRVEIDKELLTYAKDIEDMGDSAQKIRISLGIVRKIIDKYREEQE